MCILAVVKSKYDVHKQGPLQAAKIHCIWSVSKKHESLHPTKFPAIQYSIYIELARTT